MNHSNSFQVRSSRRLPGRSLGAKTGEEAHSKIGKRMEPRYLGCHRILKGRRFSAILFGLLLVGAQLLAAPAPVASARPAHACCHCGGKMSCCSGHRQVRNRRRPSRPMPARKNSFRFRSGPVAWSLPENRGGFDSSAFAAPLTAIGAPLYARDCARLI